MRRVCALFEHSHTPTRHGRSGRLKVPVREVHADAASFTELDRAALLADEVHDLACTSLCVSLSLSHSAEHHFCAHGLRRHASSQSRRRLSIARCPQWQGCVSRKAGHNVEQARGEQTVVDWQSESTRRYRIRLAIQRREESSCSLTEASSRSECAEQTGAARRRRQK